MPVLLTMKTALNSVEAPITRETGGSERGKHVSNVFVVDTNKQPLNTVHPVKSRLLLNRVKAAVMKRYPFTVILKVAIDDPVVADLRIKIDPGSKTTGIAILNDTKHTNKTCSSLKKDQKGHVWSYKMKSNNPLTYLLIHLIA